MVDRSEFVLVALQPAGGSAHTPVQVQKLLFLLERTVAAQLDGPHFDFQPYDYGPFDKAVYEEIEQLEAQGFVVIDRGGQWRTFRLSATGQERATEIVGRLPSGFGDYVAQLSRWVRSLSFSDLVSAIYKAYPEMQANSVFRSTT